ncbi:hypothetical protein S7335_2086 [Synechococcus sp. PCC 7335]|nr:hypothetical protein S7335_2086 [Synechococcus sp. PCC 7335]
MRGVGGTHRAYVASLSMFLRFTNGLLEPNLGKRVLSFDN